MKKTHAVIMAIVLLLMVSLAFAQQGTVTYGDIAVTPTPNGVIVDGQEITYEMQQARQHAVAHKQTTKRTVNQQQAAAKATQAENAASLKRREPSLKVQKTSTETNVYDVTVKNKRGITDYGVAEQTVTNPQGHQTTEGIIYSAYSPSKAAQVNAKHMEVSLAAGQTMLYNKDSWGERYATNGLAAGVSVLHDMSNHLAVGIDYMMLHPRAKSHENGLERRHYHGEYMHQMSLAGKFTLNPWDNWRVYMPMGIGMANSRLKTDTPSLKESENKWGAAFYAGLGVQYDITSWMSAGLEYRYSYAFISDKDLTPFHKDRNLQFHTLLMRVGMRF